MYNNKYILILLFMDFGPSKSWGSRSISLWLLFFVVWGKGQLLTVFCQLRFSLLCCVVPFWTKQRRWTQWDEIALSRKILSSRGLSTYLKNYKFNTDIIYLVRLYVEFFHYSLTIFSFIFHMYILKKIRFFFLLTREI